MSTITKEQAKDLRNAFECWQQDYDPVEDKEQYDMFELGMVAMDALLASLEVEPVAYVIQDKADRKEGNRGQLSFKSVEQYHERDINEHELTATPLYTAPPAPVSVPPQKSYMDFMEQYAGMTSQEAIERSYGWNACRAAMLQGADPVTKAYKLPEETGSSLQLRNLIRQRHAEWSQATFGDVGPVGPLKHLSKEALEAAEEPEDLSEWADMQFLLWDAQRRAGISDGEITAAMEEKLKVNMARQWPEPKDGEPRLHIKAAPQQEVKP